MEPSASCCAWCDSYGLMDYGTNYFCHLCEKTINKPKSKIPYNLKKMNVDFNSRLRYLERQLCATLVELSTDVRTFIKYIGTTNYQKA